MGECMMAVSCEDKWLNMTEMRARGKLGGAGVDLGQDLDLGLEAEGEGLDLEVNQGPEGNLDLKGLGPTPAILMKSLKVTQGADKSLKVDPRAERKREAVLNQVQDLGPDPVTKRLFEYTGVPLKLIIHIFSVKWTGHKLQILFLLVLKIFSDFKSDQMYQL